MPCRDWYPEEDTNYLTQRVSDFEAILCGVLSVLRDKGETANLDLEVINMVNEKECGVKVSKIFDWWEKHQENDKIRKARELEETTAARLRKTALAKLTDEERSALNLKG